MSASLGLISKGGGVTPPLLMLTASGRTVTLPGAPNALTARLIEEVGFEAAYVSGAGIANTFRGVPDIGLVTLSELVAHVGAIREAVRVPLIVDADTGFGNALNVWRTVRDLERAGADAVQTEDQTFPKRCGHFDGKSVIDASEMVDKIAGDRSSGPPAGLRHGHPGCRPADLADLLRRRPLRRLRRGPAAGQGL